MHADFWHQKWANHETAFHLPEANPLLVTHFPALQLAAGSRILVPLCGKTRDMAWLLAQGMAVVGIELSDMAVQQFFADEGVTPEVSEEGAFRHYRAEGLDIWVGDFFAITPAQVGPITAVYDRAALVALPPDMRSAYTRQVCALSQSAPQLLVCYEYDQSIQAGPPFAILADEVASHYADRYQLTPLAQVDVPGGLRGKCPATERVWLLQPLQAG